MKTVSLLEILGGICGLVLLVGGLGLGTTQGLPLSIVFAAIPASFPFALSILAGVLLWRRRRAGLVLSLVIQAAQILSLELSSLQYKFFVGASLGVEIPVLNLLAGVGANLVVGTESAVAEDIFGVNFLAIWGLRQVAASWDDVAPVGGTGRSSQAGATRASFPPGKSPLPRRRDAVS